MCAAKSSPPLQSFLILIILTDNDNDKEDVIVAHRCVLVVATPNVGRQD